MNLNPGPRILVTGANGFAGRTLVAALLAENHFVTGAVRTGATAPGTTHYREVSVGEIGPDTDWRDALSEVGTVVHLAARVHQMRDKSGDPLKEFRRVNVAGTRRLAEQAAAAGARRFVLVSSIKVNGEATAPGAAFCETDKPAPQDAYGISKYEAELAAVELGRRTGLEIVVVRPPLLVGPGAKGNLSALANAIRKGRPLPLGALTDNRRSLLDVRNFASALILCATHPNAAAHVFLISDGIPVSTAQLAHHMGRSIGREPWLLPVPGKFIRLAARLLGKAAAADRLTGSLVIDDSKIRRLLGWKPRYGPQDWEIQRPLAGATAPSDVR
jgi:nucleoside-diphosphate-sugar epimerase